MTDIEYRSNPAISRSELFNLHCSPEKFRYYKDTPQETTPSLLFGQLFHKMALEPDTLWEEFAVAPAVDKRTKAGKEEYAKFVESSVGKTVVTMDMVNQASDMCEAINKNPFAVKLLSGAHETPYFWTDEETGEACKCRTDATISIGNMNLIVDLKSAEDASTEKFMRDAVNFGYDFQTGMYRAGVEVNEGKPFGFVFLVVEKKPPYSINILQADDLFLKRGKKLYRELLDTYHECNMSGNWFGYLGKENTINVLSLPAWIARDFE